MNVTQHIRQLEAIGFTEENLDRAIALAGANRLAYQMLHHAETSETAGSTMTAVSLMDSSAAKLPMKSPRRIET